MVNNESFEVYVCVYIYSVGVEGVTCRGGGDTPVEGRSASEMRRSGSSASMTSQGRGRDMCGVLPTLIHFRPLSPTLAYSSTFVHTRPLSSTRPLLPTFAYMC